MFKDCIGKCNSLTISTLTQKIKSITPRESAGLHRFVRLFKFAVNLTGEKVEIHHKI
jgi:hypothetical protein